MSTISSRTTLPPAKVRIRASPSRRASTRRPGTRRRCTAPTSRTADHTCSGRESITISLRMEAMSGLDRDELFRVLPDVARHPPQRAGGGAPVLLVEPPHDLGIQEAQRLDQPHEAVVVQLAVAAEPLGIPGVREDAGDLASQPVHE